MSVSYDSVVAGFDGWHVTEQALPVKESSPGIAPPPPKGNSMLRNLNMTLTVAQSIKVTCHNDPVDDNIEGNCKRERLVSSLKGKAFSKILSVVAVGPAPHSLSHPFLIQENLSEQTVQGYMS